YARPLLLPWFPSMSFSDVNTGYYADAGNSYKTTNGGTAWSLVSTSNAYNINGIHFPVQDTGYAVNDAGKVLKTTNGGVSWTTQNPGNSWPLYAVWFLNSKKGYVGGGTGINAG